MSMPKTKQDATAPKTPRNALSLKWLSPMPPLRWLSLKVRSVKLPALKRPSLKWVVATSVVLALGLAAGVLFTTWMQGPKWRAVSFAKAIRDNDMARIRAASTGSDEQYKTVEAMSQVFAALRNYESAAVAKFGEAGKSKEMSMPDVVAEAQASNVMTVGDTATMVNPKKPGDKHPMKLVKKNGKWFVDLASMPVDAQTRAMSASAPRIKKAVDETAAEIRAGKYKTPQEAQAALGARMQAAVRPG
jgi:hypothetical protein